MKNNIITKGLKALVIGTVIVPALSSCSDDYLDLAPITDLSTSTVAASLTGARAAMVGLCNGMYRAVDDGTLGNNGANGEAWIVGFYGECFGNSTIRNFNSYSAAFVNNYGNWTYMNTPSSGSVGYMWKYAYNLIDDANNILAVIDEVEISDEEKGERDYIEASALTIRAHAYVRLLQTYAPRWNDSNNGNAYCLILRTEPTTPENADKDFSTMGQVLDQIYSDLEKAISLYSGVTDYSRGSNIWMPDVNVARGIYARAALLKNDYNTASSMASAALANYSIMSADEYRSGFVVANKEYIWASNLEQEGIYWYTFCSWQGFNGYYTAAFGFGDLMDHNLYQKMSDTDCRKLLYYMPELMDVAPLMADAFGITPEDFFYYSTDSDGNPSEVGLVDRSTATFKYIVSGADGNGYSFLDSYGWGDYVEYGESALANYSNVGDWWGYNPPLFGMNMKFWGTGDYAYCNYPFMRASEMGYIVAEAQYMLGNEGAAQSMMNSLNRDVRDPEFNCTATGADLLAQIKAYRTIELWNEGFNWFDLKRWGDPCTRNKWVEGDLNSGNWPATFNSYEPSAMNGWRWSVPESEYLYNKGADPDKVR